MIESKVTVLMPVYNAEKYLKEAINSILNQTYKHFVFLIIDDGSTDNSLNIIQSYDDSRIELVRNHKNLGLVETLNKGIELATTELIARMDADDISYPERLEKQVKYFNENPDCVLLGTWAREIDDKKQILYIEKIKPYFYYYNLNFECWIYHPTVMYKRSAIIEVGKYLSPYAEDFDLWWRLSKNHKIDVIADVLLDYRSSDSSLSRVTRRKEYSDAHRNLVMRNIHYYTGKQLKLDNFELEFLCSQLDGLKWKQHKIIVKCFQKLDYITSCMKEKEPRKKALIENSLTYKRMRLIKALRVYLSKWSTIQLLIKLSYWSELWLLLKQFIYKKVSFSTLR